MGAVNTLSQEEEPLSPQEGVSLVEEIIERKEKDASLLDNLIEGNNEEEALSPEEGLALLEKMMTDEENAETKVLTETTKEAIIHTLNKVPKSELATVRLTPEKPFEWSHEDDGSFSLVKGKQKYSKIVPIGRGASSVVMKGVDETGKEIIIKLFNPEDSKDSAFFKRFFTKEIEILKKLDHPNIISVQETGTIKGVGKGGEVLEKPFYISELLHSSLQEDISSISAASSEEKLNYLSKTIVSAAEGLNAAHKQGVLHRDIKPANMMKDMNGEGKIIDFGLPFDMNRYVENFLEEMKKKEEVIWQENEEGEMEQKKIISLHKSETYGTPLFMAPEYLTDNYLPGSPVSDWYAFAASIYQILTNEFVIPADSLGDVTQVIQWLIKYRSQEKGRGKPSAEYIEAQARIKKTLESSGVGPNVTKLLLRLLLPSTVRVVKATRKSDGEKVLIKQFRVKPGENVPQSFRKAIEKDRILVDISKAPSVEQEEKSKEGLRKKEETEETDTTYLDEEKELQKKTSVDQEKVPSGLGERNLKVGDKAKISCFGVKSDLRFDIEVKNLFHKNLVSDGYYPERYAVQIPNAEERKHFETANAIDPKVPYQLMIDQEYGDRLIYLPLREETFTEEELESKWYKEASDLALRMSSKNKNALLLKGADLAKENEEAVMRYCQKKGVIIKNTEELQAFYHILYKVVYEKDLAQRVQGKEIEIAVNIAYYSDNPEPVKIS